ncbi:MAG: 3'-5' exoribonuclease YhaM family protein [Anaeromyxobacteraceae bacterium]
MDKIWAKDVKDGERVKSVFLVSRKSVPTAKSGKTYLSVTFHDRTGELEARAFERVDELAGSFEEKDYVEVEGQVGTFQGKPQLRIETLAKSDPAALEAAEFTWVPPPEPKKPDKEKAAHAEADDAAWKDLLALVGAVTDQNVKTLIQAFLDDEDVATRLRRAPAAKSVHHAYPGGLLEHTVSCLKLAHRLADQYPQVDRDLLVAGAFFHDLGKIRELSYERQVEYTDEGRLIGHLVMTAQWIHDKARRVGVPRELEHHIVHLVLAHHGRLEYGSPKTPMTLEALLTHEIDELDSRVNSWLNLMGREGGTRRWTDSNNVYEHHIWRGTLPTAQAEKKGPPPEVMAPVIYVPRDTSANRGGGGGGGGAAGQQQRKRDRPPRAERRPDAPKPEGAAAEGGASAAPATAPAGTAANGAAPEAAQARHERSERPARPDRPPRGDRPDRGPGGGGGGFRGGPGAPGGAGGPGDRKRGYTGPRLPGDRGPQPRPKATALTHNPFAALAQKIEGGGEAATPAEPAQPEPSNPVPVGGDAPAPQQAAAAPESTATPGVSETPAPGETTTAGGGEGQ